MEIKREVLDELIRDDKKPEDLIGETGLLKKLTKALIEKALEAELTQHLGYEKHDPSGYRGGNSGTVREGAKLDRPWPGSGVRRLLRGDQSSNDHLYQQVVGSPR